MRYRQLTLEQRYHIQQCCRSGMSLTAIAKSIGCHKSTISREIKRNTGQRGYRYQQAQRFTAQRHQYKPKAFKLTDEVKQWIVTLLNQALSPEQICGYLKRVQELSLHHESVYRFIYRDKAEGGVLWQKLRIASKSHRKRYGASQRRRGQIPNRTSIDDRPALINNKHRIGDCEGDTIIGKDRKSALCTIVERKTQYIRIIKLDSKHAQPLAERVSSALSDIKSKLHSITFDNGLEFAAHRYIAKELAVQTYFAHPYASWERGLNEQINGLIRQYFPKGTDFNSVSEEEIKRVEEALNNRPRKSLGYKTPNELFLGITADLLAA